MIPCQRDLFEIPDDTAYLNCAYMSPQLRSVREAGYEGVDRKTSPWQIGPQDFFDEAEIVRHLFAQLLGTQGKNIAILPSVSYGIATAAANLDLDWGAEILVLHEQFPSNVYSWRELTREKDVQLTTVPRPDNFDWTTAILRRMNDNTAVVALPHVHWTDGSVIDLEKVAEACRAFNAMLVLDLTQSLGVIPISLEKVQPDFVVAAAYKWLLGPYSLAFMYVSPRFQQGTPIEYNWVNRKNSEDFAGVANYRDDFQQGARRFDVGERSNFILLPMAIAALQQIIEWSVPEIRETLSARTQQIAQRLEQLGLSVPPEQTRAAHILGARFPDKAPEGILQELAKNQVYVSLRGNAIRIAPYLYNNEDDIDRLIGVLEKNLG